MSYRNTSSVQLSIIIVSWNVRTLLHRAIQSIQQMGKADPDLEIIVVDNGSKDGTPEMIQANFPRVRLIANDYNAGFTRGNNQGIRVACGEFILLLNPDTEIKKGALQQMVAYLKGHPDVGLVGPQLLNPDRTIQSSRRRFPTIPILFLESTWLQPLASGQALAQYYAEERSDDEVQSVDWVTGAAMMTRQSVIESVGVLDESFFMYSEELDWCRRIKEAGWDIVYLPEAKIIHYEGKSSEQVVPARHIYFQSSKVHYARKYYGSGVAVALRGWLMAQYLGQIAIEGLKWLVGHRRTLRASRVRAYRQVIRSGLKQRGPIEDHAAS
jgi:N-acetylglucosaminyl-diphospho-decaprenol L-rhamnosyltransferase